MPSAPRPDLTFRTELGKSSFACEARVLQMNLFEAERHPDVRPPFADDLEQTFSYAWDCWARGVRDRRCAFHTPGVATIGLGGEPRVRTVVLRGADRRDGSLRFHTDIRGVKVAEIERDDRVAVMAYEPRWKFQVRVEGRARIHAGEEIANDAWKASRMMSKLCYGVHPAPGAAIGEGDDFRLPETPDEIEAGQENFAVVLVRVSRLETLFLEHSGHRRAVFENGEARWLSP